MYTYSLLPLLAPSLEQLTMQSSHFFGCLQYLEIFIHLRQTLFLEKERSHLEPNQWNSGQKLLNRDNLVSWSTVMVEDPTTGPKFGPFPTLPM
jgi:hypothetical protein